MIQPDTHTSPTANARHRLLIKVCGMRDADNIADVAQLDIDLMGFIFWPRSPRYVKMISSRAGFMPDYSEERLRRASDPTASQAAAVGPARVGVFVDEMPQTIVTHVYNYRLQYVQLHGTESPVMIENLKRTLVPDIVPDIKIIKAISVSCRDDVARADQYDGVADMLLFDTRCPQVGGSGQQFDWDVLGAYHGHTPFLLSGGIGPGDAHRVRQFSHPMLAGIDVNSRFETEPGRKDMESLRSFVAQVRA